MQKKDDVVNSVTVGLVQMSVSQDTDANLKNAVKRIGEAAKRGAQIVCLPELFRSRYFCQEEDVENFNLAEQIPGETTEALSKAAKENGVVVVAGIFEKRARGLYHNSAVVIDADGKIVGKYRKMHIPDDPHYYEKFYFSPGDLGFNSYDTRYGRIGVLICWDQWYPEAARLIALSGAQIIFYPTAIGSLPEDGDDARRTQLSAWETIQRSHGIANGIFIASVNRSGTEDKINFWGSSFVSGPLGETVAKAGGKEEILLAKCNFDSIDETRHWWPFLRDRRIDAYKGLSSRFLD